MHLNIRQLRLFFAVLIGGFQTISHVHAQQLLELKHFNTIDIEDGLSQGFVFDMLQDSHNEMWFATKDGLCRFDGERFDVYRNRLNDDRSLSGNELQQLLEDTQGNIWATSWGKGLNCWIRRKETIVRFNEENGLSSNDIAWMIEDKYGVIWVLNSRGLDCIQYVSGEPQLKSILSASDENYRFLVGAGDGLNFRPSIVKDAGGSLMINSIFGIGKLETENQQISIIKSGFMPEVDNPYPHGIQGYAMGTNNEEEFFYLKHDSLMYLNLAMGDTKAIAKNTLRHVVAMAYEPGKRLWMSNLVGLQCWDIQNQQMIVYDLNALEKKFGVLSITDLYVDHRGLLWLSTGGFGLIVYNPEIEKFHHVNGLNDQVFSSYVLHEMSDKKIFVRTYGDALVYDLASGAMSGKFSDIYGFVKAPDTFNAVQDIVENSEGNFWVSKNGEILFCNRTTHAIEHFENYIPYHSPELFPLNLSEDNMLWTASNADLIRLDIANKKSTLFPFPAELIIPSNSFFVQNIYNDHNRYLWIGTQDGLLKFDIQNENWTTYQNSGGNTQLSANCIYALYADVHDENTLWLGTNGGGLCRFNKTNGDCTTFTTREGLPNDVVYGVVPDELGNLWLSTNHGLSCYNIEHSTFTNFNERDGLQSNEFNRYSYLKASDGSLIFGGVNGLNVFDSGELLSQSATGIFISNIKHNNHPVFFGEYSLVEAPVYLTSEITLKGDHSVVTFLYSAKDYIGEKHQYRYKLEGVDSDWVESSLTEVTYSNLTNGEYRFLVQVKGADNIWLNSTASYTVKIAGNWWKLHIWQIASAVLAISLLISMMMLFRKRV